MENINEVEICKHYKKMIKQKKKNENSRREVREGE
jgi:hypothetical protein